MSDYPDLPVFLDQRQSNLPTNFRPDETKENISKANAIIEHAARLKDWGTVEMAVDEKIDQQAGFVTWWQETVRRPGQRNNAGPHYLSVEQAERLTDIAQYQVSRWSKRLQKRDAYREILLASVYRKAMGLRGQSDQRGASGTGENDWHTPVQYLDAARSVLGNFDLDPATSEQAQKRVRAAKYFTPTENGLAHKWEGTVWLNPPYAQPLIAQFVSKMVSEWRSGRVFGAIMLTHNYTDTAWFDEAANAADALCFTRGRIKFINANGEIAAPTQGQAFFYFGDDPNSFCSTFKNIGHVWLPYQGEA